MSNPLLAAALEHARLGRRIIRCTPGEKTPATPHGYRDGTTDERQMAAWWQEMPAANVGICTGDASGVWVLDLDGEQGLADLKALEAEHGPLPDTLTARTPSGGQHKYFLTPPGVTLKNRVKLRKLSIDVRGNGGYVVAPPSANGKGRYEWMNPGCPVATAPPWLIALATGANRPPPSSPPPGTTANAAASVADRARKYMARVPPAVAGQGGHDQTFWSARVLVHGFAMTEAEAFPIFAEYNATCLPPWDEQELNHKLKDAAEKPFNMPRGWLLDADRSGGHQPAGPAPRAATVGRPPASDPQPATEFSPRLVCVDDVEAVEVSWLWPDRVPRGYLTMLVGRPGEGKSWLAAEIAARVSTGTRFPDGGDCPMGSVILLNGEDDPADTLKPRLVAAGADCRKVHVLTMAEATDKDGKTVERVVTLADIPILEEALGRHPDAALVVVDPIGSYLGVGTDAHRDNEVRGVLAPLAALAAKHDVAVLLVAHTRKSPADFADDTALGSRAFTAICRSVLHLMRDPEDEERRLLLAGKSNLAKSGGGLAFRIGGDPARVVWEDGPVTMTADDALAAAARVAADKRKATRRGPPAEKLAQAVDWLGGSLRWNRAEVLAWLNARNHRNDLYDAKAWPAAWKQLQDR